VSLIDDNQGKTAMKTNLWFKQLLVVWALTALLAGCNLPGESSSPTPDLAIIVSSTQTAMAIQTVIAPVTPTSAETAAFQPTETLSITPTVEIPPTTTPTSAPPTPTQQANCTDRAVFVSETIPDGSSVKPGQQIEKTWRLRNSGDCTWSTGYALVFKNGAQMDADSPQALQTPVAPGETAELKVELVAPASAGTFRSEWMLVNAAGQEFGLGLDGSRPFWVEIVVSEAGASLDLGTPDWFDSFDADLDRWYLDADENIEFAIDDGFLTMTAFHPSGDNWRIAELRELSDFYLEAKATFGEQCSGKDSFGFIVRAPDLPSNVIDTGYVFSFACDGNFRYYRMDGGEYVGLQNWKTSASLNAGAEQTNQVGVWAEGNTLRVYINGDMVAEFTDGAYARGLFGLLIRSEFTNNFTVAVDEMSYWTLP